MSIGSLPSLWQHVQQQNAASQASTGGTSAQSAQDWLNSLLSATGTTPTNDTSLSTATLSDQMQAMLVQLQGGNTVAPDASGQSAVSGAHASTSATQAASGHHHHHHRSGGPDQVDQGTDNLAVDAAGGLTGSDASGLDNGSGGFMQSVTNMLATVGSAAAKGAVAGAVMAAI